MAWSDLLGEQWPYSSSLPRLADRACHDELVRIEVAWARALSRGGLQSSCKAQSATKLAAVFANASQQLFPFPMATMLVCAAEANLLDSHSWRILRELNVLCDPRAAMHPRADAFLIAPDLSDSALRMQRDAVEGAGYGRTQRRLGRTQRAPPLKFGSGSLAGALYTDALFARLSSRSRSRSRSRRDARRARRGSIDDTDELPTEAPSSSALAGVPADVAVDVAATRAGAAGVAATDVVPPPLMHRSSARRAVATSRAQALREAPPSLRGSHRSSAGRLLDRDLVQSAAQQPRAERSAARENDGGKPIPLPAPRRLPPPPTRLRSARPSICADPEQAAKAPPTTYLL